MPLFSIITPVFNGAPFIEETVQSVLRYSSNVDFEYIVIDDGSTDATALILGKYKDYIRYFYQENRGQASAINYGIRISTGRYCTIVNADDPLNSSELFHKSSGILDANRKISVTYPDWQLIDESGNLVETIRVVDYSIDEMVGQFNCLVGPGGVFRTSDAKKIGGWNTAYKFVPDYDFWLRLLDFGDFEHIPEVLASWRTHGKSISIGSRGLEMSQERIQVIEDYLTRNPTISTTLRKSAKANSLYRAALLNYFDPRVNGRQLLIKCIRIQPTTLLRQPLATTLFLLLSPLSNYLASALNGFFSLNRVEERIRRKLREK
jgi:glycosyltransferase involved in cell wall biosynthesis